jgi:cyclomaltodextrinase
MTGPVAAETIEERGPDWVRDAVFYQVFPDRFSKSGRQGEVADLAPWGAAPTRENFFGGDLPGITEKLDHLERLGATALYMTPIFKAGSNHRYDTHDYFQVDPLLGDDGALRELVDEAHRKNIRVILDGVFNHVGDGFWAFEDLRINGDRSTYRDWFLARELPLETEPPNYQTCGGAAFLPKLNPANADVRDHVLRVATHWIDQAGIDGWRLDVPWKVPHDFWRAFRACVKQARPSAYLVGEAWWSWGGLLRVFDGLMNYRLRSALLSFCLFDEMDAEDFAIELQLILDASEGGARMLNLLGSHDTPRLITLADGDVERTALALSTLFVLPGAPMLYYGDEIGMEGGEDPDCRRTMEWDEAAWNTSLFDLVRNLAALRNDSMALRRGDTAVLLAFNRVLAVRRRHGADELIAVLNAGAARRDFVVPLPGHNGADFVDALGSGDVYPADGPELVIGNLPARTALLLRRTNNAA